MAHLVVVLGWRSSRCLPRPTDDDTGDYSYPPRQAMVDKKDIPYVIIRSHRSALRVRGGFPHGGGRDTSHQLAGGSPLPAGRHGTGRR